MKANLVVHPDKVKQKGGTLEQVCTAERDLKVTGGWARGAQGGAAPFANEAATRTML